MYLYVRVFWSDFQSKPSSILVAGMMALGSPAGLTTATAKPNLADRNPAETNGAKVTTADRMVQLLYHSVSIVPVVSLSQYNIVSATT
jgi:hypothetical protein